MGALPKTRFSVDDYLRLDREAESKSEYIDGVIVPIEATVRHSLIQVNLGGALAHALSKAPCRVLAAMRTRVTNTKYFYPDLSIVCSELQLTDEFRDTATNPKAIIEILSPSTADYDGFGKFQAYRALPTFVEYFLVAQDEPRVDIYTRTEDDQWLLRTVQGPDATLDMRSLNISIPLSAIYHKVLDA